MKKTIFILISVLLVINICYAGTIGKAKADYTTVTSALESGSWTPVDTVNVTSFENYTVYITNNTTDSTLAYRILGFVYPSLSSTSKSIVDSTQIGTTGVDYKNSSSVPYGKIRLDLFNVSDSCNYT